MRRANLIAGTIAMAMLSAACGAGAALPDPAVIAQHIDAQWFRQSLIQDNLAHWLSATKTPNGFFQTTLDRQWRPRGQQTGTLVTQNRLIFDLAVGYDLTGDPAYLQGLKSGADFLLNNFYDNQYGLWYWSVSSTGAVASDVKDSYGQAFTVFGLSHAYRETGDQRYLDAALQTWDLVNARLRDSYGGLKAQTSRDFSTASGSNTQNPMMHLFEAGLALYDASGSAAVFSQTQGLADHIFTTMYQPEGGYLPEAYTTNWQPAPANQSGRIDVGHQFEWAYLLSVGVSRGMPASYLDLGQQLLNYGLAHGYDTADGGIWTNCNYDGTVRDTSVKSWWQQAELLRALMDYAALHGRSDVWDEFDQSLAFVKQNIIDSQYGGWFADYTPSATGGHASTDKGSIWKAGYHEAGMYREALRLAAIPAWHPGDANGDSMVDVGDLGILGANYGRTNGATWTTGDFTGDGAVDVGDLGILGADYGWDAASMVPEPATLSLLTLAGLMLARHRQ